MFTDKDENFLEFALYTTRYLGREDVAEKFFELLYRYRGIYLPESWDTEDRSRLRHSFQATSRPELIKAWTAKEEWKTLVFARKRPKPIEMSLDMQRFSRAKFNKVLGFIHEDHFRNAGQEKQLLEFVTEISLITKADYGFIAHHKQEKRQSPALTPAERLPGIYWANFFGRPYIEFFGREKLLSTPCYDVREISRDLILLLTAETPLVDEMIKNDEVVNQIKAYLNQNAFAGPNFPGESCAVPKFRFDDVRGTLEAAEETSSEEKLARLRNDLQSKGYELLEDKNSHLSFRGTDGAIVFGGQG